MFLAHPVAYKYEDNFDEIDIINIIKDIKPDGIRPAIGFVNANFVLKDKIAEDIILKLSKKETNY